MGTKNNNNLFFTCSLIEYIGRTVKQKRGDVVKVLGKNRIERIYSYADVFRCEPIEKIAWEFIEDSYSDQDIVKGIWEVYHSWISDAISDYNTDFYYQPRDYIAVCYDEGKVL